MSANLTHKINDLEKLLNVSYLRDVIVPEIERMVEESNIDGLYDEARQFLNTTFLIENVIPEIEKVYTVYLIWGLALKILIKCKRTVTVNNISKALLNLLFICNGQILLYYKRKFAPLLACEWCKFPLVIQKYTKLANFARLYFPHFSTFRDQILHFYYF